MYGGAYDQGTPARGHHAGWSTRSSASASPLIWGEGTTACASDSKKFGAWDQNLMTEYHARLRRTRGYDLLARREELRLYLLSTENLLVVGSGGHDRGGAASLHRYDHRKELCRLSRTIGDRTSPSATYWASS